MTYVLSDEAAQHLERTATFCMVGRMGDSDQGRAARVTWQRDPWLEIATRHGPPGWLHAVNNDPNLVTFSRGSEHDPKQVQPSEDDV
jgi:hypothetical protein